MKLREILQQLEESIPLAQTLKYRRKWNKKESDKLLEPIFKNKNRLYFDFDGKYSTEKAVTDYIEQNGYEVDSESYINGFAKKGNNKPKIGKLLNNNPILLKAYNEDSQRKSKTKPSLMKLKIVISRHPHDIATMSTDRAWESCMTLSHTNKFDGEKKDEGTFAYKLEDDIKNHTLVAYLIAEDDTNIQQPLSRLAIRAYFNEYGEIAYPVVATKIYGDVPEFNTFYKQVASIMKDFNKKLEIYDGKYTIGKNVYADGTDSGVTITNGEVESEDKDIHRFILKFEDALNQNDCYKIVKKFSPTGEISNNTFKAFVDYIDKTEYKYDLAPLTYFNLTEKQEMGLFMFIKAEVFKKYPKKFSEKYQEILSNHFKFSK